MARPDQPRRSTALPFERAETVRFAFDGLLFYAFWSLTGLLGAAAIFGWPFTWPAWSEIAAWRPAWTPLVGLVLVVGAVVYGGLKLGPPQPGAAAAETEAQDKPLSWTERIRRLPNTLRSLVGAHLYSAALSVRPISLGDLRNAVATALGSGLLLQLLPPVVALSRDNGQVLGATIGFFGLATAALFNAHLTRRRDDRVNSEQADAIRSALIAELDSIKSSTTTTHMRIHNAAKSVVTPEQPQLKTLAEHLDLWLSETEPAVYPDFRGRLDAISALECNAVLNAYAELTRARNALSSIKDDVDADARQDDISDDGISIVRRLKALWDRHHPMEDIDFARSVLVRNAHKNIDLDSQRLQYMLNNR